jgi:hypothetical protein
MRAIRHKVDIVIVVRVALATTVLALAVIAAPPHALAKSASRAPTPAQIRRAVRAAEGSSSLWATINICSSRRYPHTLGVRGQMPALGFSASLSMLIQANSWSNAKRRFIPDPSPKATVNVTLGKVSSGLQQDGGLFSFPADTGPLNATIVFTWTRDGTVLGQTTRRTTAGHMDADFGSPPRFSAAQCRIR